MSQLIILLLVIAIGLSAYARAHREGTWSWPLFAKTTLGASALVAVAVVCVVWLGSVLGPEHAGLVLLIDLAVTAAGVTVLALWLRSKQSPGKR
jgi:uncharacterized membrane protein YfcA